MNGTVAIMNYLRVKYVKGKDDQIELWARE